jgi:hypothetical protein
MDVNKGNHLLIGSFLLLYEWIFKFTSIILRRLRYRGCEQEIQGKVWNYSMTGA